MGVITGAKPIWTLSEVVVVDGPCFVSSGMRVVSLDASRHPLPGVLNQLGVGIGVSVPRETSVYGKPLVSRMMAYQFPHSSGLMGVLSPFR